MHICDIFFRTSEFIVLIFIIIVNSTIYHPLVIFKFNQKNLMRYVNMRYANMNIYIIEVEHK